MKIKSKLPDVGVTIFTVMSAMAKQYKAINLSQGFPDFPISGKLKEYLNEALQNEQVQYAPLAGRPDLLEALATKLDEQHKIEVVPEKNILITAGATQAIYSIISSLVHEKDEVILFDPAYDCYDPVIRFNKGIPVHINLKFPSFNIDWNEVKSKVTAKTRMIIINNPHNPSGAVLTEDDLKQLENLVKEYPNLIVLSDEVYEHIQFSGKHQSILGNEVLRERGVAVYSFGKTFHVTGWKIGYCVAPESLMTEIKKHHQYNVFCVNNSMQYALAKYLENFSFWDGISSMYEKRRDLFLDKIKSSRFKTIDCHGTYFSLLDYSEISDEKDTEFAKRLCQEFGVAVIPVSVFYQDNTDNKVVRVCFAKQELTIKEGVKRLCQV